MLRIKQIGTICFAIFSILISAPLFATDIPSSASSADCKYNPLETYTGTSNLEAGWQANTIQLHWYNGDTEIQNVPSVSQSCTYDGTLTPPSTIPTRTGYTFKGWRVKQSAQCSLSGLNASINPIDRGSVNASGVLVDGVRCLYVNYSNESYSSDCSSNYLADLNNGGWKVGFSYGILRGVSSCNNTNPASVVELEYAYIEQQIALLESVYGENFYEVYLNGGMSSEHIALIESLMAMEHSTNSDYPTLPANTFNTSSSGDYCWCQVTSFSSNQCTSPWIYVKNFGDAGYACADNCAHACAQYLAEENNVRSSLYSAN